MKRILFFNDSLIVGGTEILLVNLLNHLSAKECEITLLLPVCSKENVLLNRLSEKIIVKYLYPETASYFRRKVEENIMLFLPRVYTFLKGVKASDYDEVVCFKETFYARFLSVLKLPKVLWIHNIICERQYEVRSLKERLVVWLNKKHVRMAQQSYLLYDRVVCVSDAARKAYVSVVQYVDDIYQRICLIHNAIDSLSVIGKSKEPIIDFPHNRTNFILVTRNSPEKRVDRILKVASRLLAERFSFHVYIIGGGLKNDEMMCNLSSQGLSDTITVVGGVDNPYPYISGGDWSLCVSERESFSLSLLESMVLKTPVITTDCGGPRDVTDEGRYGLLVANSEDGIYEGMKAVLVDRSLITKYSVSLDEAVARFDYATWLGRVENLLGV